ncbi:MULTISPECIES: hypothetical protein [unclassified Afipia]|uniref:hypothetical protein n=1 Tax=unclassified Afipia TaxID=2642050 RepID=UPI0004198945|nr:MULTISPECIES: hypothetical protein [unclassified Afipia]
MFYKSLVVLSATLVLAGSSAAFAMSSKSNQRTGARAELITVQQPRQVVTSSDDYSKTRLYPGDNDMDRYKTNQY